MPESPTTTEPKRKRRWFQYSLRTFFVMMTAVCIWLGWLTNQARQQRAAVAWVEEMGGMVYYDYEMDEDGVFIEDGEQPGTKWLRETLGIDFMADVVSVELYNAEASDLAGLAGLKKLQGLMLTSTQVSDVTPLAGLMNLHVVDLRSTEVSDVTPLAVLEDLQLLDLKDTPVSDVTPLAELKMLMRLSLVGTQVSEEQVTRLRRALPKCRILWPAESQ